MPSFGLRRFSAGGPGACPHSGAPGRLGTPANCLAFKLGREGADLGDQHGGHPLHALRVGVQSLGPSFTSLPARLSSRTPWCTRSWILPMTSMDRRPMRSNAATTRASPCLSLKSTDLQPLRVATPAAPAISMSAWILRSGKPTPNRSRRWVSGFVPGRSVSWYLLVRT